MLRAACQAHRQATRNCNFEKKNYYCVWGGATTNCSHHTEHHRNNNFDDGNDKSSSASLNCTAIAPQTSDRQRENQQKHARAAEEAKRKEYKNATNFNPSLSIVWAQRYEQFQSFDFKVKFLCYWRIKNWLFSRLPSLSRTLTVFIFVRRSLSACFSLFTPLCALNSLLILSRVQRTFLFVTLRVFMCASPLD